MVVANTILWYIGVTKSFRLCVHYPSIPLFDCAIIYNGFTLEAHIWHKSCFMTRNCIIISNQGHLAKFSSKTKGFKSVSEIYFYILMLSDLNDASAFWMSNSGV